MFSRYAERQNIGLQLSRTAGEEGQSYFKTPSDENVKINENEYCIRIHIFSFTKIKMRKHN